MPENTTTLSEFAANESIHRTVNEYATSYETSVPEDVFEVSTFSGYLSYTLVTRDGAPALHVTPNPDVDTYGENVLLVTGEDCLPIPRGIIEPCAPDDLMDWKSTPDGFSARLGIPPREDVLGERLARGSQSINVTEHGATVTLPKHPELAERPACSLQVVHGEDGFELVATLMSPDSGIHTIEDAMNIPETSLPKSLAQALDSRGKIPVSVFEGGPITTRRTLIEKYNDTLGVTDNSQVTSNQKTTVPLPEAALSTLDDADINAGAIRVVPDDGDVLIVCDSHHENGDRSFRIDDGNLVCNTEFARWLKLPESDTHWHFHDGTLVGETLTIHPDARRTAYGDVGDINGNSIRFPRETFEEAGLDVMTDVRCIVTAEDGSIGFALIENVDVGIPLDAEQEEDSVSVTLPESVVNTLSPGEDSAILSRSMDGTVVCIPMDEDEARRQAGVASPEEMEDARLHIPPGGQNVFVQQVGEGDPAISLPREVTEQFDLEEGSKFRIRVGTYNGTLSMYCEPIDSEEVGADVCMGRMLSQSNLRLPMQLVATLSLFERSITWGLLWESDGPRLLGLIEGVETPPLSEGLDVGDGQVYTTKKSSTNGGSATHYAVTIPREAFDVYSEHPPGVFVTCESIGGVARIVLLPIGEEDLGILGSVKLREHWDDDYYEVTLPKALAVALGTDEDESASWTFLNGQFVGTLASPHHF